MKVRHSDVVGGIMGSGVSVSALLAQAKKATKQKDWLAAGKSLRAVLKKFPKNKQARDGWNTLKSTAIPDLLSSAQHATAQQSWVDVESNLGLAIALGAQGHDVRASLTHAQLELGEPHKALKTIAPVLDENGSDIGALNAKARALRDSGQGAGALVELQKVLALGGTDTVTLNSIGLTHRAMGDFEAAADYFRRALVSDPNNPTIHNNLSQVVKHDTDTDHIDQMKEALAKIGAHNTHSTPLHFALFKAFDETGDVDKAFYHLQAGNKLAKDQSGYEFESDGLPYALSKILFADPVELSVSYETAKQPPIFVTGLPRTGTTLAERILSQSDEVMPCGELTVVSRAVGPLLTEITGRKTKTLTAADMTDVRGKVLNGISHYTNDHLRAVDKMPTNFRWIGYMCLALPEAHIVHMNRNPISVAWSLYRHHFTGRGIGYSNDFRDIVKGMVLHRDLMTLWRERFPGSIIDVQYDHLVEDPEAVTRHLAEATELTWSSDWVSPETSKSEIRTASAEQARQAIYTKSDEAWRKYERQLAPLVDMLKAAEFL